MLKLTDFPSWLLVKRPFGQQTVRLDGCVDSELSSGSVVRLNVIVTAVGHVA